MDGTSVGNAVENRVVIAVGFAERILEGSNVGVTIGNTVGLVTETVGNVEGFAVGVTDGDFDCAKDGTSVEDAGGTAVGMVVVG